MESIRQLIGHLDPAEIHDRPVGRLADRNPGFVKGLIGDQESRLTIQGMTLPALRSANEQLIALMCLLTQSRLPCIPKIKGRVPR